MSTALSHALTIVVVCAGRHRIVRLRVVAPAAATNHSASESISAYWPSKSVARSTAGAQEAASNPVELPADRPGNEAKRVRAHPAKILLDPFKPL